MEGKEVQPLLIIWALYVPLVLTKIDCVVCELDQIKLPLKLEDNVTEPFAQNVVFPELEMTGADGKEVTLTWIVWETLGQPWVFETVNE